MKSDRTILNTFIFLLLSWILIGTSLYFVYQTRTEDFIQNQREISTQGLRITSKEIDAYITQSRHLLELLIRNQRPEINALYQDSFSESEYEKLRATVQSYFPEFYSFNLVTADGNLVLPQTSHQIGDACHQVIQDFIDKGKPDSVVLHGDGETYNYHIDIVQKIPDLSNQGDGVFFVSLDVDALQNLLSNGQPYHHNFYLISDNGDGQYRIDISTTGVRDQHLANLASATDFNLSDYSHLKIPGTVWTIMDAIDAEYLASGRMSFLYNALGIGGLYLVLSLLFYVFIRRGEIKRIRQDEEIMKLNFTLTRTVRQRTTQLEQSKQLLTYQATHDALTGLKNRREFEIHIGQTIEDVRNHENFQAVVIYIDIDHLKIINETCGLGAGDEMIKQIAFSLSGILRRNDLLARIGGDEFGILLKDCDLVQAELIALTIKSQISTHAFIWDNKKFDVTASIGVAEINSSVVDASDLLRQVDSACYAAKEMGRNQVHMFHPDDTMFQNRRNEMYWSGETIRLIESGRMELYGQKIAAISGSEISDWFEILVRLRDEDGKLIFPDVFIPALEQYGGIEKLDRQVITQAIEFLASHPGIRLNINLSGKSVGNPELLQHISRMIEKHKVLAESLVFEITETVAMTNISQARKFIQNIKEQGCQLALDDFGSGMSSFSYLKNLDVDYVKLDGSFVRNLHQDPVHYAMVEAINRVAEVMGKECVAEYVENQEIMDRLAEIGIAYGQGYFIHKPQSLNLIELHSRPDNNSVDFNVS